MKSLFALGTLLLIISFNGFSQSHRDSLHVCHYFLKLDMTKFSTGSISGEADLKIVPKAELNSIPLDLYRLTVDSVFVNSQSVSFFQHDTLLRINYATSNLADTLETAVFYHGKPQKDSDWGGFFTSADYAFNIGVGMGTYPHSIGRYWFPCIDSFTDRATYEYLIKTNPGYRAVCSGLLMNVSEGPNYQLFYWKLNQTIPTYLSSMAVGPFITIDDEYIGIEHNIPIQIYASPEDSAGAVKTFSKLKQTLAAFEKRLGPYRWDRVGYVVVPFQQGAMEHATNIAFSDNALSGSISDQNLAAHELSHSWFGNLVTCSTSEDMWLNEGWASYCEIIFKEEVYGNEEATSAALDNHLKVLKSTFRSDGYLTLNQIPHDKTYSSTVYDKGSDIVRTLRGYLGDSLFFKGAQAYLDQKSFDDASSQDLCNILTASTGIDLHDFFDTWVFHPGFPHYSIDSMLVVSNGDKYDVTLAFRQKEKARQFVGNSNKIEVTLMDKDWNSFSTQCLFDGKTGEVKVSVPFAPITAMVDANQKIADARTSELFVVKEPGSNISGSCDFSLQTLSVNDSALVRVEYNWIPADDFITPFPGVVVSNFHYWTIEGIFPEGFQSTGRFSYAYSQNTNPDNGYVPGMNDTTVLLYRKHAGINWQVVARGSAAKQVVGRLTMSSLVPGEYALGFWDGETPLSISGTETFGRIKLVPNPASENLCIEIPIQFTGKINCHDTLGKIIWNKEVSRSKEIVIPVSEMKAGIYVICLEGNISSQQLFIKE